VCVKENVMNTRDDAVCKVSEEKPVENSGAPVHVTLFNEFAKAKNKIGFSFKIEHVGDGSIYKRETDCNAGSLSMLNENLVWVNVDVKPSGVTCTGLTGGDATSGYTRLFKGSDSDTLSKTVTCTQDLPPATTAYTTVARITIEYDYKEFVSKDIIVKH